MIHVWLKHTPEIRRTLPNFGANPPELDLLADWLLGGNRKRRVIAALVRAPKGGRGADHLVDEEGIGRATVFEVIRALKAAGALERPRPGRYRVTRGTALGKAIHALVAALEPAGEVDRPPSRRR